ncbi:MAG: hypothetical protein M1820_009254 [Bogoriella megaspora]|nr:MAG: hypothetical protein M1820_009254 [Bogoriella megaspora]
MSWIRPAIHVQIFGEAGSVAMHASEKGGELSILDGAKFVWALKLWNPRRDSNLRDPVEPVIRWGKAAQTACPTTAMYSDVSKSTKSLL